MGLGRIILAILQFFFPKVCPVCEQPLDSSLPGICKDCKTLLATSQMRWDETCSACNIPEQLTTCQDDFCNRRRIFFDRHVSLFYYRDRRWKTVVGKWKFKNDRRVHELFWERLWEALPILRTWEIDRIVYIQSAKTLQNKNLRTFQPCQDIAQKIAEMLKIPNSVGGDLKKITVQNEDWLDSLAKAEEEKENHSQNSLQSSKKRRFPKLAEKKKKKSQKQSHQNFRDRFLSIHNSIVLAEKSPDPNGLAYLLVEDIYTTGATANEAARRLKLCRAKRVYVISALQALA